MPGIGDQIEKISQNVREKLLSLGRSPDDCLIVAVSKTHPAETVLQAIKAGITDIGENKVQEASLKLSQIRSLLPASEPMPQFHFIGRLQSNKVKQLMSLRPYLIQSVDSLKTASLISDYAQNPADEGSTFVQDILIQVNTSMEASKSGVSPEAAEDLVASVVKLKGVRIRGLMTIGPLTDDPVRIRASFRQLKDMFDTMKRKYGERKGMDLLSMGMTDDHLMAIEEGANLVRIGSAIFGYRNYGGTP